MLKQIKIAILIPAYNEELSIGATIDGLAYYFPNACYVVVDNNSSDKTTQKSNEAIIRNSLTGMVLFEPKKGKANAVKLGFQRVNPDLWVMTDADATYSPLTLYELVNVVVDKRVDHGVADRLTENNYSNHSLIRTVIHKFGNKMITKLIANITGIKFKDVLSGGRVFTSAFTNSITIESDGFQLESELNIKASELNVATIELPTAYGHRKSNNPSKLSTFNDGFKILKYIISASIYRRPERLFLFFSIILFIPGLYLSINLINYFLSNGSVPYTSTAVAAAIFLIISFQTFLFSIYIKLQYEMRINNLRRNFSTLKRNWNDKIDKAIYS
jgi:glycosyltransferase involved in cell wall biosynthesis